MVDLIGSITSRCSGEDQTRHERAAEIEPIDLKAREKEIFKTFRE